MTDKKLTRLKKAEEQKILDEHKDLYESIVRENYPQRASEQKSHASREDRVKIWPFAVFGPIATAALVFIVVIGFYFINGINGMKGADQATGGDAVPRIERSEVEISAVENVLVKTSLRADHLKLKKVTAVTTGSDQSYFDIEIETYHTFEIAVQIGSETSVFPQFLPKTTERATVNGFDVEYAIDRRNTGSSYYFETKAVVDTGEEKYYITYNYVSESPFCELLGLVEFYIRPKNI